MPFEIILLIGAAMLAGLVLYLYKRSRPGAGADDDSGDRSRDGLDTVAAWPPEVTRVMTSAERSAYENLVKALPECIILAQVPLARFIKVPRRNSYAEWLTRVGHLSVDLLICDRASLVVAAVALRTPRDSERGLRRRARMTRVLKAAGVKVFVWREEHLPSPESARDQVMQRTQLGDPDAAAAAAAVEAASKQATHTAVRGAKIPVAEVLVTDATAEDDSKRREPPPSTWFDDLDSGPTPLDPARRPRTPGPGS